MVYTTMLVGCRDVDSLKGSHDFGKLSLMLQHQDPLMDQSLGKCIRVGFPNPPEKQIQDQVAALGDALTSLILPEDPYNTALLVEVQGPLEGVLSDYLLLGIRSGLGRVFMSHASPRVCAPELASVYSSLHLEGWHDGGWCLGLDEYGILEQGLTPEGHTWWARYVVMPESYGGTDEVGIHHAVREIFSSGAKQALRMIGLEDIEQVPDVSEEEMARRIAAYMVTQSQEPWKMFAGLGPYYWSLKEQPKELAEVINTSASHLYAFCTRDLTEYVKVSPTPAAFGLLYLLSQSTLTHGPITLLGLALSGGLSGKFLGTRDGETITVGTLTVPAITQALNTLSAIGLVAPQYSYTNPWEKEQ
ncbi:hypothetical protein COY95_02340 [Candidatus Woesearchaeota archaeon CG_4_10_14_0_8_um_filter_47_5]|nr:MAG: hypothetical protein COY95_02340 [Candidatus Woesearchaeota archaeon CG_4_10_14_0_8_um_filter_47_5]